MRHINYVITMIVLLALGVCSCKDKEKDTDEEVIYSTSTTNALVMSFSLKDNPNVSAKLDSVHFTIDPARGEIYNVDSLPVGTNVSSLLTTVRFSSSVREAKYYLTYSKNGTVMRDTITYRSTSTDSLNFTGSARLDVTSYDGSVTRSYNIHVNVHKSEPDTLSWPLTSRQDLPGAGSNNTAHRAIKWGNLVLSLLHNESGYHLSSATTSEGPWETIDFAGGFEPDVNSLTCSDNALYLLDTDGMLHTSTDGENWTTTGTQWQTLIGGYTDRVLGISVGDEPLLDEYPRREDFIPQAVPANFPLSDMSQLVMSENMWAVAPQAVLVGGVLADGTVSNKTWGYDGNTWAVLSNTSDALPALRDAILVSYLTYNVSIINYSAKPQDTWLVMGGYLADGTANRVTYTSTNQGITWSKGATSLQWPGHMPSMGGAQAIIDERSMSVNGAPRRRVTQPVTEWVVPYIYLFGGYAPSGELLNNVWCGVITRMTYKPTY